MSDPALGKAVNTASLVQYLELLVKYSENFEDTEKKTKEVERRIRTRLGL